MKDDQIKEELDAIKNRLKKLEIFKDGRETIAEYVKFEDRLIEVEKKLSIIFGDKSYEDLKKIMDRATIRAIHKLLIGEKEKNERKS